MDALEITKKLVGSTWDWAAKETVVFQEKGKGRWSLGNKEFTWKVTDGAARKIEGINGKGHPFQLVLEPSMEAGTLEEATMFRAAAVLEAAAPQEAGR